MCLAGGPARPSQSAGLVQLIWLPHFHAPGGGPASGRTNLLDNAPFSSSRQFVRLAGGLPTLLGSSSCLTAAVHSTIYSLAVTAHTVFVPPDSSLLFLIDTNPPRGPIADCNKLAFVRPHALCAASCVSLAPSDFRVYTRVQPARVHLVKKPDRKSVV